MGTSTVCFGGKNRDVFSGSGRMDIQQWHVFVHVFALQAYVLP
jgi:hypothetical protein